MFNKPLTRNTDIAVTLVRLVENLKQFSTWSLCQSANNIASYRPIENNMVNTLIKAIIHHGLILQFKIIVT